MRLHEKNREVLLRVWSNPLNLLSVNLFVFLFPLLLKANIPYYNLTPSSPDFKSELFLVLNSFHLPQINASDKILTTCPQKECFRHTPVGYKKAREHLFGQLHLRGQTNTSFYIKTSYCQEVVTNEDLSPQDPLAPMNIPDPKVLNAEHTWPQSLFSKNFSTDLQKSDLHILLPELSHINSQRSNHPFGYVNQISNSSCRGAALGKSATGRTVFEPHDAIKGNVARALFYFSIRYQKPIDPEQEVTLREWHSLDPVNREEISRNEKVFQIQKVRNPFIDNADWVDLITDF
jgi:deoxyribonuclease I